MICYLDMTFCEYRKCVHWGECDLALTELVKCKAKQWWGKCQGEPPIAVFAEHPECYQTEENEK